MTAFRYNHYRGCRLAAVSLVLVLLTAGCAMKQDVLRVDETVGKIRNDQLLLRARIDHIDSMLTSRSAQDDQLRADVQSSLGDLNQQLVQLKNQLNDMQQIIYRLSQRTPESGSVQQPILSEKPGQSTDTAKATDTIGTSSVDCRRQWDNAFKDMYRGQYDLAIAGFSDYLKYCPKGDLSDNSQYWIAEAYYEMGQNEKAIDEYNRLLKDYPDTEKKATAYFKLGRTYEKLGDTAKALDYYLILKKDYSGSVEYEQVKDKIAEWEKPKGKKK